MKHTSIPKPPGFTELSKAEQIRYVEVLWDSIAEHSGDVPVPESHLELASQRLAEHRRDPCWARHHRCGSSRSTAANRTTGAESATVTRSATSMRPISEPAITAFSFPPSATARVLGRTHTLTYEVSNASGRDAHERVTLVVAHDQRSQRGSRVRVPGRR